MTHAKIRSQSNRMGLGLSLFVLTVAIMTWFAFDPSSRAFGQSSSPAINMPKDEFERRVRQYLLDNPEVIIGALRQYEARKQAAELGEAQQLLKSRADEIYRDPDSPVGGNPKGDVTLVEFFDYNCPYCRRVAPVMLDAEKEDSNLRIVYKEFPILGPNSQFTAKAALAAVRQGKYLAFHKALMLAKGVADKSNVMKIAKKVGLDTERLKSDMKDPKIEASIKRNLELAQALRINGTPGFVVGDQFIRGATDLQTLKSVIQSVREARQENGKSN